LALFLICICIPSIHADDTELLQFNKTKEESSLSSKIQPILIQWQQAENQNDFAKNNNLPLVGEKVKIYIYLDSQEMKEKLPPEITVIGFDGNIVGALVSSDNLDTLGQLDFVQRITVPVSAQTPPVPQIENQEPSLSNDDEFDYLKWVLILGVFIFLSIVIIKKSTTFKTKPKKNSS
jgi:hypothetical protein